MKIDKVILILIIILICFFITGCSNENQRTIEEKVDAEIEYIENVTYSVIIKHIKNEYYEDDKMNWDLVKDEIQLINSSWVTFVLDYSQINSQDENISKASQIVNEIILSISNKDENELISSLQKFDSYLIKFKENYTEDKNSIKKMKVRNFALEIYSKVLKNDYISAEKIMNELENYYDGLMKDESFCNENRYNLNKVYVLIQEYKVAVKEQNIDLIKMKYLNFENNRTQLININCVRFY